MSPTLSLINILVWGVVILAVAIIWARVRSPFGLIAFLFGIPLILSGLTLVVHGFHTPFDSGTVRSIILMPVLGVTMFVLGLMGLVFGPFEFKASRKRNALDSRHDHRRRVAHHDMDRPTLRPELTLVRVPAAPKTWNNGPLRMESLTADWPTGDFPA